jgi:outer membrane biosynthesis protein TonB
MMKSIGAFSTTALFLLLGFAPMADARQEKPEDKPSPPKQEQPAKPEKQQQEAKAPKQEQQAKPEKQQQQAKAPKQEQQAKPEKEQQAAKGQQQQEHAKSNNQQQQQVKGQQQQHSEQQTASSSNGPQRTQEETATQHAQPALRLSHRGSGRIPDERFRSNFGREHEFRMGNPVMVSGYSRFQYGGYWFGYVEPWPAYWYYTDPFYIDYVDGGYYMYDPYYPGSRFAITVVI